MKSWLRERPEHLLGMWLLQSWPKLLGLFVIFSFHKTTIQFTLPLPPYHPPPLAAASHLPDNVGCQESNMCLKSWVVEGLQHCSGGRVLEKDLCNAISITVNHWLLNYNLHIRSREQREVSRTLLTKNVNLRTTVIDQTTLTSISRALWSGTTNGKSRQPNAVGAIHFQILQ